MATRLGQKSKRKMSETVEELEVGNQMCEKCQKQKSNKKPKLNLSNDFINLETNLSKKLINLQYGPNVVFIYNPLDYAKELHDDYIKKYCEGEKEVMLLGMNPGPWGMCQTGVPFGEVSYVKQWLKIEGEIKKPDRVQEKRPIQGFNCKRSEVSGSRLWALLKELSGEPKVLFKHVFVHNYCPLAFLSATGKNITPPELKVKERKELESLCDDSLIEALRLLNVKHLICVGNYILQRAKKALDKVGVTNVEVSLLMHPSPVNPKANKGWKETAIHQLKEAKVLSFFNCA